MELQCEILKEMEHPDSTLAHPHQPDETVEDYIDSPVWKPQSLGESVFFHRKVQDS